MELSYDTERSAGYLTNLAARLFVRALERRMPGGAAGPMPVFIALADGGALAQKELARRAAVEQPTMANTLQRMERDGLIARTPDPADRRSSLVSLSPLGREHAAGSLAAARAVSALAMGALEPEERAPYLEMLRRIVARLEADG